MHRFDTHILWHWWEINPRHLNCPAIDGIIAEAGDEAGEADALAMMPPSSPPRRRSSTTRSPATARSSPGRSASNARTARRSWSRTLRKNGRPISALPNSPSGMRRCRRRSTQQFGTSRSDCEREGVAIFCSLYALCKMRITLAPTNSARSGYTPAIGRIFGLCLQTRACSLGVRRRLASCAVAVLYAHARR
jgi:hypothetical protein